MAEGVRELIHTLGLVRFLEQEIEAFNQRYNLPHRSLIALQAQVRSRRWELYTALYRIAAASGRWQLAYRVALQFSYYSPTDQQVFAKLGTAAAKIGQAEQAIQALERAVALGNRSRALLLELTALYEQRADTNEAILALLAAQSENLVLDPDTVARYKQLTDTVRRQSPSKPLRPSTRLSDTHERLAYTHGFVLDATREGLIDQQTSDLILADLRARQANLPRDRRLDQQLESPPALSESANQNQPASTAPQPKASTPVPSLPLGGPQLAGPGLAMASSAQAALPPRKTLDWNAIWGALFSERMLRTLLYLGASLLVLSAFMWVLFNWREFPPIAQLGVLSAITASFYAGGYTLMKRLNLLRSGITLIAVGAGWVPSIGWVLGLPGLLNLDGGTTWIVISALCILAYSLSLWWLKSELFSVLLAVASISLLLALMHRFAVAASWQVLALQLLMIIFLLLAATLAQRGSQLGRPFRWIAHGLTPIMLIGSTFVWHNALASDQISLMLTWWAGLAFYGLCLLRSGGLIYEQAVVWSIPAVLFASLRALFELPSGWYGNALLLLTPIFLWLGMRRHAVLKAEHNDWRASALIVPAYSATYLLAGLALIWRGQTALNETLTAFGISLLLLISAVLFKRQVWSWLTVASLIWSFQRLLGLLELSFSHNLLVWIMLATLFWLAGALLERRPMYANAPLAVGYAMAGLLSLVVLVGGLDNTSQIVGLGMLATLLSVSGIWWRPPLRHLALFGGIASSILRLPSYMLGFALWSACTMALSFTFNWPTHYNAFVAFALAFVYLFGAAFFGSYLPKQKLALVLFGAALGMVLTLPLLVSFNFLNLVAIVLLNLFGMLFCLAHPIWRENLLEIKFFAEPLSSVRISMWDMFALLGAAVLGTLLFVGALPAAQLGALWPSLLLALLGITLFAAALFFKRAAWFYAAGSPLILASVLLLQSVAWNLSYSLWCVLAALWSLIAWSASSIAERRALQNTAFSGLIYATGTGAIGLSLALASLLANDQLNWFMPLGCLLLLIVSSLAALHRDNQLLAGLASLIGLLALVGINRLGDLSYSWQSVVYAGLVLVYLNLAALGERAAFKRFRIFSAPLYLMAYIVTPVAIGLGLRADLPSAASSLILALSFGVLAIVRRRWYVGSVAALLLPWAATQAWFYQAASVFGSSSLTLFWLAISVALVGIGLSLRYLLRSEYALPYYVVGFMLGLIAPMFALQNQFQLLIALGVQVAWWIGWAVLSGRGHLMDERLMSALALRDLMRLFVLPISPVASLWLWNLCDYLNASVSQTALAFALAAMLWMLVGNFLYRVRAQISFVVATWLSALFALCLPMLWVPWPFAFAVGGLALAMVYDDFYQRKQPYLSIVTWSMAGLWALLSIIAVYAAYTIWKLEVADQWLPALMALALIACSFSAVKPIRRPVWRMFGMLNLAALLHVSLLVYLPVELSFGKVYYFLLAFAYLAALLAWNTRRIGALSEAYQSSLRYALHLNVGLIAVASIGSVWIASFTSVWSNPAQAAQFESLALNLGMSLLFVLYAWQQRQPFWLYLALCVSFLIPTDYTWLVTEGNQVLRGSLLLLAALTLFGIGYWAKRNLNVDWAKPILLASNLWALRSLFFMHHDPRAFSTALFIIALLYALHLLVWRSHVWLWAALIALYAWMASLSVALGWSTSYFDYMRVAPFTLFAVVLALSGLLVEHLLPDKNDPRLQILNLDSWAQPFYLVSLFAFFDTFRWAFLGNATSGEIVGLVWAFAFVCLIWGNFWRSSLVLIAGLAALSFGNDYYLAQIWGASDIQRLVLLASSAIVCWWLAFGLKSWSQIWDEALQLFALLINVLSLMIGFLAVLRNPSDPMPLITALAIGGLFYIGMAYQLRSYWLSYLASGMLVCAWIVAAFTYLPDQPQLYALPAGAYLLLVAAAERFRAGQSLTVQLMDLLGVAILLGVTFAQSLPHSFSYGMLLGAEALIVLLLGILQRVRLLFFAGLIVFILNVGVQSLSAAQQLEKTLLAFVIGLILVSVAVFVERKRDYLIAQSRRLWAEFETWN